VPSENTEQRKLAPIKFTDISYRSSPRPFPVEHCAESRRAGRTNEARQILEKLKIISASGRAASWEIALVNLGLGDLDQTWVWLERAAESRDLDPRYLKIDPLYGDVVKDPRYAALLKKFGLDK
jgi:hypothetical protein